MDAFLLTLFRLQIIDSVAADDLDLLYLIPKQFWFFDRVEAALTTSYTCRLTGNGLSWSVFYRLAHCEDCVTKVTPSSTCRICQLKINSILDCLAIARMNQIIMISYFSSKEYSDLD